MEVDPPPAPAAPAPVALPGDRFYAVDEAGVEAQRKAKPWTQDATYFKRVAVSPAASTKMLAHAQRGCEAGVKAGGKPLEVMGLLLGYPDADPTNRRLIVTDALPLPVTGFETSVVADDDAAYRAFLEEQRESLEVELAGMRRAAPYGTVAPDAVARRHEAARRHSVVNTRPST